jgi:hypothetical protein
MKTRTLLLLLISMTLFACKKDNDEDKIPSPNDVVPDPEGTVLISINGDNDFKGISISDAGNFYGFTLHADAGNYRINDWTFSGLGNMMGLGNIVTIPQSGYVAEYAVRAGYGYVGKENRINYYESSYECNFIRFWVEYTSEAGAEIKYQYPFKGLNKEIQFTSNEIMLENRSSAKGIIELKEMAPFIASLTPDGTTAHEWLRLSHSENGAFAVTAKSGNQNVSAREAIVTIKGNNSDTKTVKVVQQGTTAQMKQKSTCSGWDFNTVWNISEGVSYPTFR